jgi:hypothetical protein
VSVTVFEMLGVFVELTTFLFAVIAAAGVL